MGLFFLYSPKLSKIHSSVPSSLILLHHLSPTKILQRVSAVLQTTYLPVKFLTTQKSMAHSETTKMKQNVLSSIIMPNSKKEARARVLKVKCRMQKPGCAELARNLGTYLALGPVTSGSEFCYLVLPCDLMAVCSVSRGDSISILKSRSSSPCILLIYYKQL